MQDPSLFPQMNMNPTFPEQEHLKCPRCDSPNTKFCYFNNYNLSQPRHFCKSCKRYWTKGGALRNIPVGGASRKTTKRSSNNKKITSSSSPSPSSLSSISSSAASSSSPSPSRSCSSTSSTIAAASFSSSSSSSKSAFDQLGGNFNTILGFGNGEQFGNFIAGSNLGLGQFGNVHKPGSDSGSSQHKSVDPSESDGVGSENRSRWNNNDANAWPGLSIFTPGSTYQ